MAFVDNTTYTAKNKEVGEFWNKALLSSEVLNQVFTIYPNIKNSIKLNQWDLGADIIQDEDCDFNSQGMGVLSEKTFSVDGKKVNLEYCIKTFEANYLAETIKSGSNNTSSDAVNKYLLSQSAKQIADGIVKYAFADTPTGLVGKIKADGNQVDVDILQFDKTNAIDELGKVYLAIPEAIQEADDLVWIIDNQSAKFFRLNAMDTTIPELTINEGLKLEYMGYPMVVGAGMPANTIIVARKSNLLYLTDLVSDAEDMEVISMRSTTGQPVVRFVTDFKLGFDFMIPEEIILADISA